MGFLFVSLNWSIALYSVSRALWKHTHVLPPQATRRAARTLEFVWDGAEMGGGDGGPRTTMFSHILHTHYRFGHGCLLICWCTRPIRSRQRGDGVGMGCYVM